jgi:radical SAM protein with 4Fe4S-binding SPASM domain
MRDERFAHAPARVYWELTRACDLACRHCRAEAMPARASDELTTETCERVLAQLALASPPPHVVFTGGDPLKRPDLALLVARATALGMPAAVAPSATLGLTREVLQALKRAGVTAMSLSLDGPTAAHHDGIRGVLGCFGWTLAAAQRIAAAEIPLQVNTLVTADTAPHLEEIAKVVAQMGAARWSLFFLVSVGRGRTLTPLDPVESERVLQWLVRNAPRWPFAVGTTEAPHYRRVVLQQGDDAAQIRRSFGLRDGNGIMFIAANGDVTPSGFLPLAVGNVRDADPLAIYRTAPLFRALRQPALFGGRCGRCEFRNVCGGSRARAWANGDVFGEDPLCTWVSSRSAAIA